MPRVEPAAGPFDLADLVTYAYPVGDLVLLLGTLTLLWRGVPRLSVVSLRIFSIGLLVFIAADISYDYLDDFRLPSRRPRVIRPDPGVSPVTGPA